MNRYIDAKTILATIIAFGAALVTALGTSPQQNLGHLSTADWLKVIVAFLATGAFTGWVQNLPGFAGGVVRAVAAGVGAFATAVITAYADQIVTQGELIGAAVVAFSAFLAVYQTAGRETRAGVAGLTR